MMHLPGKRERRSCYLPPHSSVSKGRYLQQQRLLCQHKHYTPDAYIILLTPINSILYIKKNTKQIIQMSAFT